jgi:excisionase family DNA binding protein
MVMLLPCIVAAQPLGTAPARSPRQSPFNERIRQNYAVLAFRAVSEFGAALLRQLDTEDVGELRRLLGVDRVHDGRLLDAPENARQLGIRPNTLVRMAREGRISATKVGRSWRFGADTSEILPPATSPRLAIRDGRRRFHRSGGAAVSAIRGT